MVLTKQRTAMKPLYCRNSIMQVSRPATNVLSLFRFQLKQFATTNSILAWSCECAHV